MPRPLRIGVNALYLIPGGVGGTEIYLRNLLGAFAERPRGHQFTVFLNQEADDELVPAHSNFTTLRTAVKAEARPKRIIYEQTSLVRDARRAGIDVLYNPGFTSPFFAPFPNVTVIHDLQHHRHPEFFKPRDLQAWRLLVWASAKQSRQLLTLSEASREDIHTVYGVPSNRIRIAAPGVESDLFQLKRSRPEPLVLCVSTLHPHKNIERLVDAFAAFRTKRPEYRLVLAGMRGFHAEAVERRIQERQVDDAVSITGWIPRSEILQLYSRAAMVVFPSTFEGFGMPVVEAMAAGVPLITTAVRPMSDTAGDGAILVAPDNTEGFIAAMEQVAASETIRNTLIARGRKRAREYTWQRTASITLDTIEIAARS